MRFKNLISLENWSPADIEYIFEKARLYKNKEAAPLLANKYLINLFFENSTRTRVSFELAAKKMGMHVINISSSSSSVKKGESLLDTLLTLEAMMPDVIILRHPNDEAAAFAAKHLKCPIINAGSGKLAHPSQALLDAFTIKEAKGTIKGLNIAICGDILHSRVARSNIHCLQKLGANIRLIAPATLLPTELIAKNVELYHHMEEGLKNVDVIMMLRLQHERMESQFIPSIREYNHFYGLTKQKLSYAKDDCIILHPGPINRGVEICGDVAQSSQSYINQQVTNGVYIRMAIIETILGQ